MYYGTQLIMTISISTDSSQVGSGEKSKSTSDRNDMAEVTFTGEVSTCHGGHSWRFILLPHWELRMPAPCPDIPLIHIVTSP